MPKPFRRVVPGHDEAGRAVLLSDAPPARVQVVGTLGPTFYEVWNTRETPAKIDRRGGEPYDAQPTLAPPRTGTRIRVLDIPPETEATTKIDAAAARAHFAQIGAAQAAAAGDSGARHALMPRTDSVAPVAQAKTAGSRLFSSTENCPTGSVERSGPRFGRQLSHVSGRQSGGAQCLGHSRAIRGRAILTALELAFDGRHLNLEADDGAHHAGDIVRGSVGDSPAMDIVPLVLIGQRFDQVVQPVRIVDEPNVPLDVHRGVVPGRHRPAVLALARVP